MSKTMIPVRMSEELVARMDAKTENRSALIVAAVEAYLGESAKQMIIEERASPKVARTSPIVRERETPKAALERVKQAVYGDWNQAAIYQKPAHASNCSCYSCKPPK